jgi:hypothetical protein
MPRLLGGLRPSSPADGDSRSLFGPLAAHALEHSVSRHLRKQVRTPSAQSFRRSNHG